VTEEERALRREFARLYELKDSVRGPTPANAYFRGFTGHLARSGHVRDFYLRYERSLQGLDDKAWEHLKQEAMPRLTARDKKGRGWQQLFDLLNEARAYNYLKSRGATNLHFIPRSSGKTPDLEGFCASKRVLCEVKTLNISEEEVAFRSGRKRVRSGQIALPSEFLHKLRTSLDAAKQQLLAFDLLHTAIHFVYLNVGFDDILGEFKEGYFRQIDNDLARTPVTDVRLVFCNDYTAFYKPLHMRCADVDNMD
jgi:hypothetical protein